MKPRINKDLQQRWNDRVEKILSTDFGIAENQAAQSRRRKRAQKDYSFFVQQYFHHLATKSNARFHIQAANYIKKHPRARAVFEWARGHAKSTHLSLMVPLWLKIQKPKQLKLMVLVSKSRDAAIRLLSDLQAELQYNALYNHDWGKQSCQGNWAEGEFKTTDGCLFVALGRGQSPRGLKDRGKRPDYIIIDDIDDDEMVRNPSRVSKITEWCSTALFGATEGGRGRFIMVGNRIAKDSVLSRWAIKPTVYHTVVNMLDKKGQPTWKENYSLKEAKEIEDTIGTRCFQKEYMNNPISEGSVFLQKQIRFGKMLSLKFYRSLICYTDPSFKSSSTADYKATIVVGKTKEGAYHILKSYVEQCSVSKMVRWHYEIDKYINGQVPILYFMETNFLQDLLIDEFRKAGNLIGHQIPIRGDTRKKPDKFARIEALQPLFERGLVWMNEKEKTNPGMNTLIEQLLMFEKGSKTHDDAPDALEGAVFLLNQRTRTATANYKVGNYDNRRF